MRKIPIDEMHKEIKTIELQNGKVATLNSITANVLPDIDPINETMIYRYSVPCPVCDTENTGAYSHDGRFFSNTQMCCSHCGIYYRPIRKRS